MPHVVSASTFSEKMGVERKDREPIALKPFQAPSYHAAELTDLGEAKPSQKHLREGSQWLWRTVSVLGNKVTVLLGSSVS